MNCYGILKNIPIFLFDIYCSESKIFWKFYSNSLSSGLAKGINEVLRNLPSMSIILNVDDIMILKRRFKITPPHTQLSYYDFGLARKTILCFLSTKPSLSKPIFSAFSFFTDMQMHARRAFSQRHEILKFDVNQTFACATIA